MYKLVLLSGLTVLLAGCTTPSSDGTHLASQTARQCFWSSSLTGFSEAGPGQAVLNIGFKESWELTLSPGCSHVDWAMKIGIVSRGSQRICTDRPAELLVPSASGGSTNRCLVRSIRKLRPKEAAAVRGAARN